ncbi:MAG TPA: hypothetical protein VGB98_05895 [Pyrinomonadaceae bacterium]
MNRPFPKIFAALLLLNASAAALTSAGALAQDARAGAPGAGARDCSLLIPSRKFDEYGVVSGAEEMSRLGRLAAALDAEDKDTKAFIIGYAGRAGRAGEALVRADSAKQILVEKSVLYNTRLNTLDCGRREAASTELWITPAGASPPPCSPTLDPTHAPAKGAAGRPTRRRSRRL